MIVAAALAGGLGVDPATAHPPAIVTSQMEKVMAEEVEAFLRALTAAVQGKDMVRLEAMYLDGFVHTDSAGRTTTKPARIAAALTGMSLVETSAARELTIRVPGGWTAVVAGRSSLRATGATGLRDLRWTAVLVRIGEGWQVAAIHESRIATGR